MQVKMDATGIPTKFGLRQRKRPDQARAELETLILILRSLVLKYVVEGTSPMKSWLLTSKHLMKSGKGNRNP
jgi:hypothetical protein